MLRLLTRNLLTFSYLLLGLRPQSVVLNEPAPLHGTGMVGGQRECRQHLVTRGSLRTFLKVSRLTCNKGSQVGQIQKVLIKVLF